MRKGIKGREEGHSRAVLKVEPNPSRSYMGFLDSIVMQLSLKFIAVKC